MECRSAVAVRSGGLRGALALRFVLPAFVTIREATSVSRAFLPNTPTYRIAEFAGLISSTGWRLLAGPMIGLVSVLYVREVAWTDAHNPRGWWRLLAAVLALAATGALSISCHRMLGNCRDVAVV
jgi:hypothetical protein